MSDTASNTLGHIYDIMGLVAVFDYRVNSSMYNI